MRGGQRVRAGKIPHKISTPSPRVQGRPIWPLAISPQKARWLQLRMGAQGADGPQDYIVRPRMPSVSASTPTAGEAMMGELINLDPAHAPMRPYQGGAHAQPNSYS